MTALSISVVLPTRNPHPERLRQTLAGLAAQTLEASRWEFLLVDNASDRAWEPPAGLTAALPRFRRIVEPRIGLTPARLRGLAEATGEVIIFVDDDNVLASDYLCEVVRQFGANPRLGAAGGPVVPQFEETPAAWTREFWPLLALHEHGDQPLVCRGGPGVAWPAFAPVGAGLCLRRAAADPYLQAVAADPRRKRFDRRGAALASGGDNDLVFTALHAGWDVGYFPGLRVTHLIPRSRLEPAYLARLNEGIMRTWMLVLHIHGQCSWPAIARWTVPLRAGRAWWRIGAWRSPAHHVRWRGTVGQFEGQADLQNGMLRNHPTGNPRDAA